MKPIVAAAGLALLVACATTPQDVMEQGTKYERSSQKSPRDAALCLTENAEAQKFGLFDFSMPVSMRELAGGGYQVLMRGADAGETIIVARTTQDGAGTRIELWTTPHWLGGIADRAEAVMRGC